MERELTYPQALNEALREEMERDPRVFLMGEDIAGYGGVFKVTDGLVRLFGPERVRDTPISEAAFVGAGLGAAMTGMRPVVEIMWVDFALVAMDQIVNQVAKMRYMSGGQVKVPLVIRTQGGGGRGNGAQHSQSLEGLFAQIPGLKVVLPATPADAKGLLKAAIRDDNPVMFIEHKMLYASRGPVPEDPEFLVPLGQAAIRREGRDVTVVAWSRTVSFALEAAKALEAEGVAAEVVDLRCLVPLDAETLYRSVRKTHRVVVAYESHRSFGPGAEVAARIQEAVFDELDAPVLRVGSADAPVPYNRRLEAKALVNPDAIVRAVRRLTSGAATS